MNIITGKDAIWETDKYDVVLVGTSIYCMLTNGFQSKIRFKYPYVDKENNKTPFGDKRKLGKRLTVDPIEEGQPIISLLYICKYPHSKRVFVDYDALENALATTNAEFKGKKVMTTLLGESAFDGNGDREKLLKIIEENTKDLDLDVYDYKQLPRIREKGLIMSKLITRRRHERGENKLTKKYYKPVWEGLDKILKELYLN